MAEEESRPDRSRAGAAEQRARNAGRGRARGLVGLRGPELEADPRRIVAPVVLRGDQGFLVRGDLLALDQPAVRLLLAVPTRAWLTTRGDHEQRVLAGVDRQLPEDRCARHRVVGPAADLTPALGALSGTGAADFGGAGGCGRTAVERDLGGPRSQRRLDGGLTGRDLERRGVSALLDREAAEPRLALGQQDGSGVPEIPSQQIGRAHV